MTISIANLPEEQRATTVDFANYQMDDDAFYDFCRQNEHLTFERNADGTIIAMPNTGGKTGIINFELYGWAKSVGGFVFDSSTAFKLPNGATRSPDAVWVSKSRWDSLTDDQQEKFPPVAPEFVIELMSKSDQLISAKEKMQEYIANGVRLGWLLNPKGKEALIYKADGTVTRHTDFDQPLSGEDVLPGFAFDLRLLMP